MAFVSVKNTPQKGEETKTVSGKLVTLDSGDKVVVIIEDGKKFLLKVIPVLKDTIIEVIEIATPLFNELNKLFEGLFRRLPTHIDFLGNAYRLTIQPAYGEMVDKVFYLIEKEKKGADKVLFSAEDVTLFAAKNKLKALLRKNKLI